MGRNSQLNGGFNLGSPMVYNEALRQPSFASVGTRHRRSTRFLPGKDWAYYNGLTLDTTVNANNELTLTPDFGDSFGIHMAYDGSRFLMLDENTGTDTVKVYVLSTPYDISTATEVVGNRFTSSITNGSCSLWASPDGTRLSISTNDNSTSVERIRTYTTTTPWDFSTVTSTGATSLGNINTHGHSWTSDGRYVVVAANAVGTYNTTNDALILFGPTSTPYEFNTTTTATHQEASMLALTSASPVGNVGTPEGVHISDDGRKILTLDSSAGRINEFTMSTPFDFSTLSVSDSAWLARSTTSSLYIERDMSVKADGTRIWVSGNYQDVYHYITGGSQNQLKP